MHTTTKKEKEYIQHVHKLLSEEIMVYVLLHDTSDKDESVIDRSMYGFMLTNTELKNIPMS